jgi:hypothetical protein
VAIDGNFVFVADGHNGLRVVDVSDPVAPLEVGIYDPSWLVLSLSVAGEYAYILDEDGNLRVVDVSNPQAPLPVASYDPPGSALSVEAAGDYIYVADADGGLLIFQRITVANPSVIYMPLVARR